MARPVLYPAAEELIRNKKQLKLLHARIEEENRPSGSKRGGNIEPQ